MTSRSFHRICFNRRLLPLGKVITRDIMTSIKVADRCRNVGNFRGILRALVGSFRFFVSLWGYTDASSAEGDEGGRDQTENGNRKDVLAAVGRRASKEGGVPVSDMRAVFKQHRRGGSNPDQENRDHHH